MKVIKKLLASLIMLAICTYTVLKFFSNQEDSLISAYYYIFNKYVMTSDHFGKGARRFLLFLSTGDLNDVKQWIGREMNYDIVVIFNDNSTPTTRLNVDELYIRKDTKFPNLKWYMESHSIDKYDAAAVWDGNIIAPVEHINALFLEAISSNTYFHRAIQRVYFPNLQS
jgi:hypothetical protein